MAKEYQELLNPQGYTNNREITNIDSRFLVTPSRNTLIINKEKVVSRKGYTVLGQPKSVNKPVRSTYDWQSNNGTELNLRSANNKLELYYKGTWVPIATNFKNKIDFDYTEWWNVDELLDILVFVNGTSNLFSWTGGVAEVAEVTSNTISKKGWYSNNTISFNQADKTINDSSSRFLDFGFTAGDIIEVLDSSLNDGEYVIESVTAGQITLADDESIETEAVGADVILRVKGTGTWGGSRFAHTGTRSVTIGGIVYEYTGGEDTGTLTGVTPNPVTQGVQAGDIATQTVQSEVPSNLNGYSANIIHVINNHIVVGSHSSREVLMSRSNDYTDFTYTSPLRKPTEGMEFILDSTPTVFFVDEERLIISARKNDFYTMDFSLSAEQQSETIIIRKLKSSYGQAVINKNAVINIKNNVAFVSFEKTVDLLARVQNITTEQSVPISDDIRDLMESLDLTEVSTFYFKDNIYIAVPKHNLVLIYNVRFALWQPPQEMPISHFAIIDGELCGHSNYANETYKLFDKYTDNGNPYICNATFGYENFGVRFEEKSADEYPFEGRLSENTKLKQIVKLDEDGSTQIHEFEINVTDNPQRNFSPNTTASIGSASKGQNPLGSSLEPISDLIKTRVINTVHPVAYFERQVAFETDQKEARFEILAYGENVVKAGNIPDYIKN